MRMKTKHKILAGFAALLLIASLNANAGKMNLKVVQDTTNVASDTVGAVNDSTTTTLPGIVEMAKDSAPTMTQNVVDEVIWVVGDEPILKSDVEAMRLQGDADGVKWQGDPDCSIPEQIAVQKLYLHQAAIDSIEVSESDIQQGIDDQVNYWISLIGSREKLEEYRKQSISQIRQDMHDDFKNRQLIQKEQESLVKDIAVTPADVREYFRNVPADSLPFVPTEVEVEILTKQPKISQEEINRVKDQLREFTDRINKGEATFATLARLYSEDPVSARQGGELGYVGRGTLDPEFANVAFNLTDPSKISKIVETQFGFHIIQLVDKRGDKINVRHILLKPRVSDSEIEETKLRLDSISNDIRTGKFTFEAAASYLSDDKDTRNSQGLMVNSDQQTGMRTSKFQMRDLPTEIARVVDTLKVSEISAPFQMINSKGQTVCAIIRLKNRTEGHRATINEDFQVMKDVVMSDRRRKKLHDWVVNKIKHTYVRMNDRYKTCDFEYQGWVK